MNSKRYCIGLINSFLESGRLNIILLAAWIINRIMMATIYHLIIYSFISLGIGKRRLFWLFTQTRVIMGLNTMLMKKLMELYLFIIDKSSYF